MTNLEVQVRQEDPENVIVSTLVKLTSPGKANPLYGGDLEAATAIMRTMGNRIQYLLQTQSDSFYKKEAYIGDVFQNIVRSTSNVLSLAQRPAWRDLHASQQMKIATQLLLSLEENAFLLAEVTESPEYLEEASTEICKCYLVRATFRRRLFSFYLYFIFGWHADAFSEWKLHHSFSFYYRDQ